MEIHTKDNLLMEKETGGVFMNILMETFMMVNL
jgi:hypothetical protein